MSASRRSLRAAALGAALLCAGCGSSAPVSSRHARTGGETGAPTAYRAHPQVIEPVAGAGAGGRSSRTTAAPSSAGVSVSEPGSGALARPMSEQTVLHDLALSGMSANPRQASLTADGLAIAPIDAPAAVQEVIAAGNQIAHLPYIWGGGHMTYEDTGYDCSGSLSYVFAAAGLLDHTVTSGELEDWGDPGPGKWITVFATGGHTFMYVAGLRFDTVALAESGTRWSNRAADEPDLSSFAVRHPPGL